MVVADGAFVVEVVPEPDPPDAVVVVADGPPEDCPPELGRVLLGGTVTPEADSVDEVVEAEDPTVVVAPLDVVVVVPTAAGLDEPHAARTRTTATSQRGLLRMGVVIMPPPIASSLTTCEGSVEILTAGRTLGPWIPHRGIDRVRKGMKGSADRHGRGRLGWIALVALACLGSAGLAGCGGGKSAQAPQATVPSAATSVSSDPYAVPPKITAAYVQRVLNALDVVDGEATHLIVTNRALVPAAVTRLRAIDSDSWFTEVTDTWADDIGHGLTSYRPTPGDRKDNVKALLSGQATCVFAQVQSDFSAVASHPVAPETNYIQLVPLAAGRDPAGYNPTPWMINVEGSNSQGLTPKDPCDGSR